MYEKQGTPPCGALNSYIWNKCIGEIADVIEDIALLRAFRHRAGQWQQQSNEKRLLHFRPKDVQQPIK